MEARAWWIVSIIAGSLAGALGVASFGIGTPLGGLTVALAVVGMAAACAAIRASKAKRAG